jgi:NAD(P)-dependent dehydrogenase (short-subunit alcohol dehydrogenase family)
MSLKGRTALVTGAGRSVGLGVAKCLAEAGATVGVNDLHADRAEAAALQLRQAGSPSIPVPFDVTDYEAVRAGVAAVTEQLGPIDILVNNAGVVEGWQQQQFLDSTPQSWVPHIQLNLYGSMNCIHSVLPDMVERGWGRIVQISSGASSRGLPIGVSIYGAAKAGIEGLLRHIAVEVGAQGVTANALALGLMDNNAGRMDPNRTRRVLAGAPISRFGRPEEVGAAAVWLASEEGGFVTGQVIHLNGGSIFGR